jgi:hypothetical protein
MTAEKALEENKQSRSPILLEIDECVKEAVRKGKRIDLMSIATGSFFNTNETFTIAEILGGHSRQEVQSAIDDYGREILESKEKVEKIILPPKDEGYRKIEVRELKAENNNFFFGEEIIKNKRGEKINQAYYIRGAKTSLAERLRKVTAPLLHPQN